MTVLYKVEVSGKIPVDEICQKDFEAKLKEAESSELLELLLEAGQDLEKSTSYYGSTDD